jgi:hypothetical protein
VVLPRRFSRCFCHFDIPIPDQALIPNPPSHTPNKWGPEVPVSSPEASRMLKNPALRPAFKAE